MKRVTAFRHLHFEDLGAFEAVLRGRGWRIDDVDTPIEPRRRKVRTRLTA